jgi:Ferric reductase like transmembrane component
MIEAASAGPSAYWYLTRGTGTVALILLTLSVALGVANSRRLRTERLPRFVVDAIHRNVSLLAIAFTALHVVTSLLDGFAPITVVDAFIPFTSAYRPLWLGFGAVAFDLLLALVITSLLRRRFGYRLWRLTHWSAYACWPIALLHTFGTGSDVKFGWLLAISAICAALVIAAVLVRATGGWPSRIGVRVTAIVACAAVPLCLIVWLPNGPLGKGWAKRAGTPAYLLVSSARTASAGNGSAGGTSTPSAPPSFNAPVTGTARQGELSDGLAVIHLSLTASGQQLNAIDIRIAGEPVEGGGVQMTSSKVTLGSSGHPTEYSGHVTDLRGTDVAARLRNSSGSVIRLVAQLQLGSDEGSVSGTVRVGPVSG